MANPALNLTPNGRAAHGRLVPSAATPLRRRLAPRWAYTMPRASLCIVSIMLCGCCGPGYDLGASYDRALIAPVEISSGEYSSPEFVPRTSGKYSLALRVTRDDSKLGFGEMRCVLGHIPYKHDCVPPYQRARFTWRVVSDGMEVARGDTYSPKAGAWPPEGLPLDQSVGTFAAVAGRTYMVSVNFERSAEKFNLLNPRFEVGRQIPGLCERWGQ